MYSHGHGKLALCGCGKLHFTYGQVTLHFGLEEFLLFTESVGRLGAVVRDTAQRSTLPLPTAPDASICH
jgi:hypothetical protein